MIAVQSELARQESSCDQGGCYVWQIQLGSRSQSCSAISTEIQFQDIFDLIVSGRIASFVKRLRGMDFPKLSIP